MFDRVKNLFGVNTNKKVNTTNTKKIDVKSLSDEEQREVMYEVLNNLDLSDKSENTKQIIRSAINVYDSSENVSLINELEQNEEISSFEETLHTNTSTAKINKPLRSLGIEEDININKYLINADYREEVIFWLEKLFFTDEHLGGAAKKIVKMLSTNFKLSLKYENNTVLKKDMLKTLERVRFGDMNIYPDEVISIETNKTALNNMALQMVVTGAIGRVTIVNKGKALGTTPIDLKHAKPYITKDGNIEWLQQYQEKKNMFEYLIKFKHDDENVITDTNYVVNPHRGVDYNGVLTNNKLMQVDKQDYLKLNPRRFIYQPALTYQDNPIGIPPLLTAIASGKLERSMMGGVAAYSERFNAVSFLKVLVRPITAKNGEKREAYAKRVEELLTKVTNKIEKGFKHGFFIGFTGVHDVTIDSTQADANGFNTLYKWAVINKSSGLGIPPLLLGVETQVSESLARILIQTMIAELQDYQDAMSDALLKFFNFYIKINYPKYALRMKRNGIILQLDFEKSTIQDRLRYEQAEALRVNRLKSLVEQGIISNNQMAEELGYSKSYLKNPPSNVPKTNAPLAKKNKSEPNTNDKPTRSKVNSFSEDTITMLRLKGYINGDDIYTKENHHHHHISWDISKFNDSPKDLLRKDLFTLIDTLQKEVGVENVKFANKVNSLLNDFLDDYNTTTVSYGDFIQELLTFIEQSFFTHFDYNKISQNMVNNFKKNFNTILKTTGAANDFLNENFHTYFKNVSNHYLGKFIKNKNTVNAINNYLIDKVVTNEVIVFSDEVINTIRNMPNVVLPKQDYQLKRVISTTVSKYQNAGNVLAMESIGTTHIQVLSLKANNTCSYCKALDGKKFPINVISNRYKQVIDTNTLENLDVYTPFVTNLYKKASDMPKDVTLLGLSGVVIPFHSHCQCIYQVAD